MRRFTVGAVAAISVSIAGPAFASGQCETCYRREVRPAQYGVVQETVVTRPAQSVAYRVPAQLGVVQQTVEISPAATVARHIPAEYRVVHETVQIAPASRGWTTRRDAHGRDILCETTVPARYGTVARQVMVRPGRVVHEHIPARYGTVARTVVVRPESVVTSVVPAQYGVVQRRVQVAPATEQWVPVSRSQAHGPSRHHAHGAHRHGGHGHRQPISARY
jgi:hypothetical protein